MYIEQGYRANLGYWKFLVLPLGLIALFVWNLVELQNSPQDVDELLKAMIDRLGSNVVFAINLIPLAVMLFGLWFWTAVVHPQSIRSLTTARKQVDWCRIGFSFLLWGLISAALILIPIYLTPADYQWNFQADKFLWLALIAIALVPLQTSFEEYMFRGHMMQGIGLITRSRPLALLLTSVLFGLMHIANPEVGKLGIGIMFFYVGTGLFLGIITLLDDGLELALGFHAANNIVGALLLTADWTAFQTHSVWKYTAEPRLGLDILVPLLVIYPLLILIMSRKYGWKDIPSKLLGRVASREKFEEWNRGEVR